MGFSAALYPSELHLYLHSQREWVEVGAKTYCVALAASLSVLEDGPTPSCNSGTVGSACELLVPTCSTCSNTSIRYHVQMTHPTTSWASIIHFAPIWAWNSNFTEILLEPILLWHDMTYNIVLIKELQEDLNDQIYRLSLRRGDRHTKLHAQQSSQHCNP